MSRLKDIWFYIDLYLWFPFKLHVLLGGYGVFSRLGQLQYLNKRYESLGKELEALHKEVAKYSYQND